jgi:superfamily I DNA/RNA helicase
LLTTPNSYKGYESEVVLIPCADQFVGAGYRILAHSLYVAMTRARSILAIYAQDIGVKHGSQGFGYGRSQRQLSEVLHSCAAQLTEN